MKELAKLTLVFRAGSRKTPSRQLLNIALLLPASCLLPNACCFYFDRPVADGEGQHRTPIACASAHRTGSDTVSFAGLKAGEGILDLANSQHIGIDITTKSRHQVHREFATSQFYFGPQTMP